MRKRANRKKWKTFLKCSSFSISTRGLWRQETVVIRLILHIWAKTLHKKDFIGVQFLNLLFPYFPKWLQLHGSILIKFQSYLYDYNEYGWKWSLEDDVIIIQVLLGTFPRFDKFHRNF